MFVPDGEDPDSLVQKKGKEHFENLIKKAMPLSDFLFQHLLSQVDMTMRDSKPKLAALAAPLFNKLTDIIFKQMMTERLCQLLGIEEDAFLKLLVAPTAPENKNETKKSTPMRSVIAIVLQYPELVYALPEFPEFQEISVPGMRLLNELLAITRSEKEMTTALDYFDKTAKENTTGFVGAFKGVKKAGKYHADKGISGTANVVGRGAAGGAIGGTAGAVLGAAYLKARGMKMAGGLKKNLIGGAIGGGALGAAMLGIPYGLGRLSSKKKKKKS